MGEFDWFNQLRGQNKSRLRHFEEGSTILNESFYEYLFRLWALFYRIQEMVERYYGSQINRLYFDQFGQIPLVFPPVNENKIRS